MSGIIFSFIPKLEEILNNFLGDFATPVFFIFDFFCIYLFIKIAIILGNKLIDFNIRRFAKKGVDEKKTNTVCTVSKSIWRYVVYFIGVIAILNTLKLGNTVSSLLATAGIGGLAIGFGAQSLIKDIISGLFLLFENQISVGDYVKIAGITGTIEEIQLRVTKVRAFEGEVNIIPNGQVTIVTNYSRGINKAIVDVPVSYEYNMSDVIKILNDAMSELSFNNDFILTKPEVVGTVDLGDSAVTLRIVADCKSMEHFGIEREMRKSIIEAFEKNNISFPCNKMVILNHTSK